MSKTSKILFTIIFLLLGLTLLRSFKMKKNMDILYHNQLELIRAVELLKDGNTLKIQIDPQTHDSGGVSPEPGWCCDPPGTTYTN